MVTDKGGPKPKVTEKSYYRYDKHEEAIEDYDKQWHSAIKKQNYVDAIDIRRKMQPYINERPTELKDYHLSEEDAKKSEAVVNNIFSDFKNQKWSGKDPQTRNKLMTKSRPIIIKFGTTYYIVSKFNDRYVAKLITDSINPERVLKYKNEWEDYSIQITDPNILKQLLLLHHDIHQYEQEKEEISPKQYKVNEIAP